MSTNKCKINLELNLNALKLSTMLKNYEEVGETVIQENMSCEQYLYRLTELEVEFRHNRRIESLLKRSQFPLVKTLSSFNFNEVPGVKKEAVLQLADGNFVNDAQNVVFYGGTGSGKTHLAIALGRELCQKGYRVLFINACDLVQMLIKSKNSLSLDKTFKNLGKYDLVILDELGFIPFEKSESDLLFQFVSKRYERGSILVTTNLVFKEWDKIFKDLLTTAAVVDRLIHHCVIMEFNDSYRAKEAKKKLSAKGAK